MKTYLDTLIAQNCQPVAALTRRSGTTPALTSFFDVPTFLPGSPHNDDFQERQLEGFTDHVVESNATDPQASDDIGGQPPVKPQGNFEVQAEATTRRGSDEAPSGKPLSFESKPRGATFEEQSNAVETKPSQSHQKVQQAVEPADVQEPTEDGAKPGWTAEHVRLKKREVVSVEVRWPQIPGIDSLADGISDGVSSTQLPQMQRSKESLGKKVKDSDAEENYLCNIVSPSEEADSLQSELGHTHNTVHNRNNSSRPVRVSDETYVHASRTEPAKTEMNSGQMLPRPQPATVLARPAEKNRQRMRFSVDAGQKIFENSAKQPEQRRIRYFRNPPSMGSFDIPERFYLGQLLKR